MSAVRRATGRTAIIVGVALGLTCAPRPTTGPGPVDAGGPNGAADAGSAVDAGAPDGGSVDTRPTLHSGNASLVFATDGSSLTFARAGQPLLTFHPDAFQVATVTTLSSNQSFDPYWLLVKNPPAPPAGLQWYALAAGQAMRLVSSTPTSMVVELDYAGATAQLTFAPEAPNCFSALMTASVSGSAPIAYLRASPDADPSESFYGLGEWGDTVNHRGKLRPMQIEVDAALESGDDEGHVPVPLLVGTRGWGMFVQSKRPGVFNVAASSNTRVDVVYGTAQDSASGLAFHLFSEPQPLDLFKHYYDVAGYPGLPAPWAYGPLLWRNNIDSEAQVLSDIGEIRSLHLATSGIWFDRPYATGVETFDFNPTTFPDPMTMLQGLQDAGLRYGVWQAPYTAPDASSDPAPMQLAYATAQGYFPPVTSLALSKFGKPIDFTNPDAYAWWQSNLRRYTDPLEDGGYGVEGFKLDYAEEVASSLLGLRTGWKFHDGETEETMHYGYTMLYHQIHRELLPAAGGFMLCRTGRWGDQVRGSIIWPGDLDATMAHQGDLLSGSVMLAVGGLPAALIKGLSLSASGFPFYASDTGGYRQSPPNNETWTRWVEANAVFSAMEVGDGSSQMPWEFTAANGRNAQSLADYQTYASLHLRLFPYAWTYANEIASTGRPIVRPVGLAYPALGQDPLDELLFGDVILSAPVVTPGQTSRTVLFPPGTWIGWWDGLSYEGGAAGASLTVPAGLDTLPLFLQRGGLVPMLRETIDTLAPVAAGSGIDSFANDPGALWVRVAPGPSSSLTVYDGSALSQALAQSTLSLSFQPGSVFTSGALFEVIATPTSPITVTTSAGALTQASSRAALDGMASGWFWESTTGGTLWIKVAGAAALTAQ